MAIAITPNIPSTIASSSGTGGSGNVLQAGQVVTAQVVQVLGNDQVQIAIGNQTIEASTQVPLQAGERLQLQVSQTASGIGLAIVNAPSSPSAQNAGATAGAPNAVVLAPTLAASLAANLTPEAVAFVNTLTPTETQAVSIAAQTAATQQTSLAPLFADLTAASGSPNLPPQVQAAAAQVLAQQTTLDQNLTGSVVKQAFQSSGLFLEASLASGASLSPGEIPDLKAALVVLRQALTTSLSSVSATGSAAASTAAPQPGAPAAPQAVFFEAVAADLVTADTNPAPASGVAVQPGATPSPVIPALTTQVVVQALAPAVTILAEVSGGASTVQQIPASPSIVPEASAATPAATSTQGSTAAVAAELLDFVAANPVQAAADPTAARAAATGAALNLLQEAFQTMSVASGGVSNLVLENSQLLSLLPAVSGTRLLTSGDRDVASNSLPPPPISGALPSAQPVAAATLSAHAPLASALQHLLSDTDGAIARQTLLQIASLSGQADASNGRIDPTMPRWSFEIPFATPQGTAMAQFEISRDGGGRETEAAKATWRARFSLNVEPAGPVHALVSLNGDRTSVRMWAERPATATQLRAGVSQLSQALTRAELKPGDIVIRDGAPVPPPPAPAGHFLNRAS